MAPGCLLTVLPHFETPLHSSCLCLRVKASAFLMELALCVMDCLSLFGTGDGLEQSRVFLFGSRELQVCGDPRLLSLVAIVARLVMLTSQLCRGSFVLV